MTDFVSPPAAPVQSMAQAVDERPYRETRPKPKKRLPLERPKPAPENEPEVGIAEDDQPKHTLDIDA
jgi:hypothetical protein